MCQATDALRRLVGISEYTPGPIPHARVRKPTRFGARGNGHAAYPGIPITSDPLAESIAREHRLIRSLLADMARRWGRA